MFFLYANKLETKEREERLRNGDNICILKKHFQVLISAFEHEWHFYCNTLYCDETEKHGVKS